MKIAFFEVRPDEQEFFEKYLSDQELFFFTKTINEDLKTSCDYDIISVFVHSRVTEDILDKLPNLKYIQTRSTGYDHIDCKKIYEKGIVASNVAGYGGPAVSEFAFSLLLNATRKTYTALQRTKNGNFDYKDLMGIELFGKSIGILGLGTIGSNMAKIAKGFGMNIVVFSRTRKPIVDELNIDFSQNIEYVLQKSDILMIALPLTPSTNKLINQQNIVNLKKEAFIINVARGEIIEETVYKDRENIFCLDVISNPKYISQQNILYTPHMAYYTKEALRRIMSISLDNINAFMQNKPLPNCLKIACKRDYS